MRRRRTSEPRYAPRLTVLDVLKFVARRKRCSVVAATTRHSAAIAVAGSPHDAKKPGRRDRASSVRYALAFQAGATLAVAVAAARLFRARISVADVLGCETRFDMTTMPLKYASATKNASGPSGWWAVGISAAGVAVAVAANLYFARIKRSKLRLAVNPPSYAIRTVPRQPDGVRLRLPIVVRNTGPNPKVLAALRLTTPHEWKANRYVFAHTTWTDLSPLMGMEKFFEPVTVPGYATVVIVAEFHVSPFTLDRLANGRYDLSLDMPRTRRWTREVRWRVLGKCWIEVGDNERLGFDRPNVHFNGLRTEASS